MKKINLKPIISYILGAVLVLGGVAIAGSLTPTGSDISPTMVTLEDIYQKTQDFTYATSSHSISTESTPEASMHSLQDIWNSLTANPITSDIIVIGNTILGVEGSAETGGGALEWSADLGAMTWTAAVAYCANPANGYTRLPKLGELLNALSQQFFEGGTEGPGGFVEFTNYWSGTESGSDVAYVGSAFDGVVNNIFGNKSYENSVRCVR